MKVAYLNGVCVEHDAISTAIHDEVTWLRDRGHEVKLFCYKCDFVDVPHRAVNDLDQIVFDPFFQSCDLAVFHFGIFSPLFDVIPLTPNAAKRLVVFHNVTPQHLVPPKGRALIEKSMAQIANMRWVDHVLCDSATNLSVLREEGLQIPASVMPLAVPAGRSAPARKPSFDDDVVRIAFIGRFVKAKGPMELIQALRGVAASPSSPRIMLDMIGNIAFSDPDVVAEVLAQTGISDPSGRLIVKVHGNASSEKKQDVLSSADMFVLPTYHEGFCVPVIEAYASGCRIIAYDNSNLPSITGGLARLVETGNQAALAAAIREVAAEVGGEAWRRGGYSGYVEETAAYVRTFSPDIVRRRFINFVHDFTYQTGAGTR